MVLGKLAYRNHMREEKNYWRKTNKLSKNLIGYESEAASTVRAKESSLRLFGGCFLLPLLSLPQPLLRLLLSRQQSPHKNIRPALVRVVHHGHLPEGLLNFLL